MLLKLGIKESVCSPIVIAEKSTPRWIQGVTATTRDTTPCSLLLVSHDSDCKVLSAALYTILHYLKFSSHPHHAWISVKPKTSCICPFQYRLIQCFKNVCEFLSIKYITLHWTKSAFNYIWDQPLSTLGFLWGYYESSFKILRRSFICLTGLIKPHLKMRQFLTKGFTVTYLLGNRVWVTGGWTLDILRESPNQRLPGDHPIPAI